MSKHLKILAILILLFSCSDNKNITTDLEKIGLTGKVKNLKFEQVTNEKEDENSNSIDNEFYFNQSGMISEQKQYSTDGLIHIYTYQYDKKNLLISKNYYNDSREFVSKSKFENEFNEKGKLIKQSEYRALGNSVPDSVNIKFNLFPDQITEFLYGPNGSLSQYNVYHRMSSNLKNVTVLDNGRIIRNSTILVNSGDLFGETNYKCVEYDTTKNCIKYKLTESDSTESYINVKIEYYK
jgi:hypothetical protein